VGGWYTISSIWYTHTMRWHLKSIICVLRYNSSWSDNGIKPTLPSHLQQNIPNHLLRTLSRLSLSGYNLNVKRLRQQQCRVPYELRICSKWNWHYVQNEDHVLLDCPSTDLTELRIKHHHLFYTLSSNPTGLETLLAKQTLKAWNAVRRFQNTTLLAF